MADSRMSSFLPTIKCSMCAQDIEIAMMGEHICAIASEPTPPPESDRTFENSLENKKGSGFLKPRLPLARVDTAAANRPFIRKDQLQLTPVSATSSYQTLSPYSSVGGRTPSDFPPRSATAPLPLNSPTTPGKFSGNLDSGFPPFGATIQNPSKHVRSPTSGSFLGGQRYEEPEQYAPVSPRSATGGGLMERMNTIAPGPFDVNGKRPAAQRTTSNGSANEDRGIVNHKPQASVGSYAGDGPKKPTVERPGGYGGFGPPPSRNGEPATSPSEVRSPSKQTPIRQPSNNDYPAKVPPPRPRRPSAVGPDLSRALPPRGASLVGSRDERRLTDAPPVPGIDLASEFGASNPYHAASDSQSSTASGTSQESDASSQSSPPTSVSGYRRKPSNPANIDTSMTGVKSSAPGSNRSSPAKASRPEFPTKDQRNMPAHPRSPEYRDPAIQGGQFSPVSPRDTSPPPLQRPTSPKKIGRPATAKGNCKGCSLPIKGKSVSSADGRLTGRYHKQCFVCKTCSEPFATTSFYVLNDAPYCEIHYHKLNNSICYSCHRGIEGQYLENERKNKYHPTCLACSDCKRVLKHDYFEMNGRIFCERDAFRRAQQQRNFLGPGAGRMEKRSTRLMMM